MEIERQSEPLGYESVCERERAVVSLPTKKNSLNCSSHTNTIEQRFPTFGKQAVPVLG